MSWARSALLTLALALCAVAGAAPLDISSSFAVTRGGLLLNRFTNTFDATVTLRNASTGTVAAPIVVVVGGLPSNVALANKAGTTPDGRPYVSPPLPNGVLAAGASLSFPLKFANPQRVAFTYTVQVQNGVDLPLDAPSLMAAVATGDTNAFLIGRVVGASNLPITVQASTSVSCVAGTLGSANPAGSPVAVTTDAGGYFAVNVTGVNPGAFVAVNVVTPTTTALSSCLVSSRDNDSWPKAFALEGSTASVRDLIDAPGKARWYKFDVLPGQTIDVRLSALPADYDLAVFKDIGQTFAKQFTPGGASTSDLVKLTAEYAPSVFSPSVFSPSVFSPSVFSSQELAQAFSTAQTRSVISVAATPGTSDEATTVNTWNNTGSFYVRVVGHNGAFDTSTPFTLTVTKGATTCAAVTDTAIGTRTAVAASALKTVILADSSRTALDTPLNLPGGGTLRDKLAAFAARPDIAGVVVDVAADARVQTLKSQAANNPACVFAKNLVAQEIKSIVDAYRANPLRYVVVVGNDDAIPFFRTPDESGLGEESTYVPPVESNSPSEASLRRDYVLSQDGYGSTTSLSLRTYDFPVPGLAVGRLVETPLEIAGLLDAYTSANGVVSPRSSLVTGYDFLADDASAVRDELQQGTGTAPATLITPNDVSPQDPSSWTADQLRAALFGARHDLIFLAGHFSANSALAADFSTSVLTTELAASPADFTNSIVFSAGCHSGYNLVDADAIAGVTQPLDWAQAFARKRATLIAGTGYQYGDTDFLEYSERIYDNFARQLRAGTGGVAVGEALVKAKRDYLDVTPDIRGLHEKALLEATLFGLPMLGIDMPAGRGAASGTPPVISASAVTTGPALSLGMKSFDLTVAPTLGANSQRLTNTQTAASIMATWQSGPDGVVTRPGEPALPLVAVNVTPIDAKMVLRGIGFRGGSYTDVAPMFPFSGAPTTELRGVHVPFVSPTFYPARLFTPNYFGALSGAGGTTLLVTPVQHRVASLADGTSVERTFGKLNLRLFYSGNLSQAALSDAPSIIAVDAEPDATGVAFTAQVVGNPAAGMQQVWVTYTTDGSGAWTPLDLTQCVAPLAAECAGIEDSRVWKGHLAGTQANLAYVVQAVSGVGLVALDDNRGAYYGVVTGPPAVTTFTLDPLPSSAAFGETLSISGTLTSGGAPVAGKFVTINVGGATQIGITDSAGRVTVQVPALAVTGSLQISAAFGGDPATAQSSISAPLIVQPAASNLAPLTLGAALTGALGGANVPLAQQSVAFAVDGPGGPRTIFAITDYLGQATLPPPGLPAGQYTVTRMSFAGNATYAATSVALAQQFSVAKTAQAITFEALADKTQGDADFAVYANASSGLAVSFAAAGACTVTGNNVHLASAGSCTITASQAGDTNFDPASPVARSFTIAPNGKADQVITFGAAPSNMHVADPAVAISATSTSPTAPASGIPIVFSSLTPPICTSSGANGETITPVAAGTCTIAANEAGDANYNPAPQTTLSFTIAAAGAGQFGATGAMLAARSDHTATLLEDGRVLIAGGFGTGGAVLGSAELYCPDSVSPPPDFTVCPSPQRGTFVATNALAIAAAGHTATRLHDGAVLLIGGANANLQWFTPATQAWSATGTLPLADRSFHTATLLADGNVFVAGGVDSTGATLATTFIVDTSTNPFTIAQGPDLAFARESHTATLLPDGTVLIAGGRRKLSVDFAVVGEYELFDPSVAGPRGNGAISDEGAMSRARFWHAAEIAGLNVVVTGGSCDPASAVSNALSSTELFSFGTGPEPTVACNAAAGPSDLAQARRAFTMTPLQDGTLVVIGGADGSGTSRNTSELFSVPANTFAPGPSLTTARAEHQATLLLDGRVLVTGGVATGGAPLASAEILNGTGGSGTANQQPFANAGTNQSVTVGATVQLTSTGSSDPEGHPLAYFWTLTSKPTGSNAQLSSTSAANPTFIADKTGTYVAQLVVNDGGAPPLDSAPASVQITAANGNQAPVAAADAYSLSQDSTLVVTAANGVLANDSDADANPLTAVLVASVSHGTLTLNADGGFTYAPAAGYSGGDSFSYHANDGTTNSNSASVALTVTPVTPTNHAPVANAGSDQSASIGQPVQLGGTCTDADNDATAPTWSLTSKPATSGATLSSTSILAPSFTPDVAGSYVAQLVCNDGKVDGAPSAVTITAAAGSTPSIALDNVGLVGIGRADSFGITLSAPAPAGGLVVTLTSDNAAVYGIVTSTVTVAAGQTQATGSGFGAGSGTTTLRASAIGYSQGTLAQTVTSNITIVVGPVSVPVGATASLPILVIPAAPAGGLQLALSSDAPTIASVSATISIPAGQTSASGTVVGVAAGTATIVASASGYATVTGSVSTVGASTPVQWTVANGGNDHWYQFVFSQNGVAWDESRGTANNATFLGMPGYLATITSKAENDFVYALAKYPAGATGTLFDPANPGVPLGTVSIVGRDASASLGGSDLAAEGTWRWINGPEAGAVFWLGNSTGSAPAGAFAFFANPSSGFDADEPNNTNGAEHFAQLRYPGGFWNDGGSGALTTLPGTNADGTRVRAPVAYIVEYSPPAVPVSTFTVTNLDDSGVGSLRDAITEANQAPGPAMVVFASELTGTITLTNQIQISGPVTIVGPGADKVTIDATAETGSASGRVFSIFATDPVCPAIDGPDYVVSISGLTLANALNTFANTGGAIFTEHSLTLDSIVIRNNVSRQGAGVGVLVQYPGQTLSISNSQFVDNFARPVAVTGTTALSGQQGAGVYVVDRCSGTRIEPVTVSIANSVFSGNHAQPATLVGRGAAITIFSHADTTIVDTRIVDNHVDVPNPPVAGLNYRGAGLYGTGKSLRIERSEISGNSVDDITGSDQSRGGGLALFNDLADLQTPAAAMNVTIVDSTISGNAVSATGGGIWLFGNIALEVDNSTIAGNAAATGRTGGILLTTGSTSPAVAVPATAPTLRLVSSILANSAASTADISTNPSFMPSFSIDASNSLVQSVCSTCNIAVAGIGNLVGIDPRLAPLTDNGGVTRTHALLPGSPAIDAGSNPLDLSTDQRGSGFPRVAGNAADMGAFESGNAIGLSLPSSFVAVGGTSAGTIMLSNAAPAGGIDVTLTSSAPGIATVSPALVSIPQGTVSGAFTVSGVAPGDARISAAASGYTGGFVDVSSTTNVVTVGGVRLVPGGSAGFPVTLSQAAPAGGLTVTLSSANTGVVTVPASVFIPAGTTSANPNPIATATGLGTTTIVGTAADYAPGSGTATVALTAALSPNPMSVVQNTTAQITLTLSQAAPAGGLTVNLSTENGSVATAPATLTVAQGNLSAQVPVTGVAAGQSTVLHASGAALTETTATINVVAAPALSVFGGVTIGKDLEVSNSLSLAAPAPAGNLTVTVTSADPSKLLLSTAPTVAGSASVTIVVGAGSNSGSFFVHALAGSGSASITASAPGYADGSTTFTLVPSGFFSDVPGGDFTTNQLASNTPMRVCVGQIDPNSLGLISYGQLRGGITASVFVASSDTGVGAIVNSPYTFSGGDQCSLYTGAQVGIQFDPVGTGTTTLSVVAPSGFSTPASLSSYTATVGAAGIALSAISVGKDLQIATSGNLQGPAPTGGLDVTLTSADSSKLLLSPDATTAGTASIVVNVPEGQQGFVYYGQGIGSSGSVRIDVSAAGFGSASTTATLVPSGFFSDIPGGDFTTSQLALNTPIRVCVGALDPVSLNLASYGTLRAGVSVDVTMTSSNTAVGAIVNSPYTFNGADQCSFYSGGQVGIQFNPVGTGTTTLTVVTPNGFSMPSANVSYTATVSAAAIDLAATTIGKDLQVSASGNLAGPAPAGGLNVTLTSTDPAKLLLSPDATTPGTSNITLGVPEAQQGFSYYMQALAGSGTVSITASAPGFGSGSTTASLAPSGFFSDVPGGDFTTNQLALNTPMRVCVGRLDPSTLQLQQYGNIRAGLSPSVSVASSNTTVGSIVNSPYTFNGGDECSLYTGGQAGLQFNPIGTGTTIVTIVTPNGFSTPAFGANFTATVGAAGIDLSATTIGKDLEAATTLTLQAPAPAGGVDVTIASADPSKVLLASDATTAGTPSIIVNVPEGQQGFGYYVHGLANTGTVQISASAPGFGNGSTTASLAPSGFFSDVPGGDFATDTSHDTAIRVCVAQLDPTTLNVASYGQIRGGTSAQATMSSSNTGVGVIVNSPVTFTGGTTCDPNFGAGGLAFHPLASGTSVLTVSTPGGFSTPSNLHTFNVTVNQP